MEAQTIGDCTKSMITVKASSNKPCSISADEEPKNSARITIKEFLNFLRTAYQVQDSVEGVLMASGMTEAVNWLKKKEHQFLLQHTSCQTSEIEVDHKICHAGSGDDNKEIARKKSNNSSNDNNDPLKIKLNEVLSEGLLDSVLPYWVQNVPSNASKKSSSGKVLLEKGPSNQSQTNQIVRRRSTDASISLSTEKRLIKADSDVEIHVCDEVKNLKKTFFCNQKLLVKKMGYFAEVAVGQKLEDMDISVHCDIGIFDWLMQWVKKDSLLKEDWPQLDPQSVIPILVSAAFLQMEPLLHDCLLFCHQKMSEILRTSTNLSCLNDSVLTRLAAMYTNLEVESIRDRKDKIQSRLFSKLIMSLAEPEPESVRGHWSSLAHIFRCEKCRQLVSPNVALKISCIPSCMRLQSDGTVVNLHSRDPSWNINDHILSHYKTLRTWRKVYWRLWGEAHFLFCTTCKRYFPTKQISWCRHHPDVPQFFTLDAQKAPLPIGRYPCCGERAYRFQLFENYAGCQFQEHTVTINDEVRDSAVVTMLEAYRHLIEEPPPQLLFPERLTRLVARDPIVDKKFVCKETFWWDGFEIIPPRPKMGLLTGFANRALGHVDLPPVPSEDSSEDCSEDESSTISISTTNSEDASAESNPPPVKTLKSPVLLRKTMGMKLSSRRARLNRKNCKLWQHNLSARSNQDIQRAYEENAIKEMTSILNRKSNATETFHRPKGASHKTPIGGLWMRLEAEWREHLNNNSGFSKFKNPFTAKLKPRGKFS